MFLKFYLLKELDEFRLVYKIMKNDYIGVLTRLHCIHSAHCDRFHQWEIGWKLFDHQNTRLLRLIDKVKKENNVSY